jgi:acetoin:2,6-dichlorophenolindophenol oxidoreductase subunit alpha
MDRTELYRRMLLARRLEERVEALHRAGKIPGALHLANGQEAVGIGVGAGLERQDIVRTWVRGHHQVIGRGMPLRPLVAELMGRATGSMQGRGGHQFLAFPERNLLGGCGVIGSVLPVACGHALAQKLRGEDAVTCVFFGDGGANIGPTWEAINLAAVWKLGVVFVCENNGYACSADWPTQSASPDVASRAAGFGVPGVLVDGNDLDDVINATRTARARAAAGAGPTLIECRTYRMANFSTGDLGGYVPDGEREAWARRDPIERFGERIGLPYADHERLRDAVDAEIDDAVGFAEASPFPDPTTIHHEAFV